MKTVKYCIFLANICECACLLKCDCAWLVCAMRAKKRETMAISIALFMLILQMALKTWRRSNKLILIVICGYFSLSHMCIALISISATLCKNLFIDCRLLYKSVKARWVQHNNALKGERPELTVAMGILLTHKEDHIAKNNLMNAAFILQAQSSHLGLWVWCLLVSDIRLELRGLSWCFTEELEMLTSKLKMECSNFPDKWLTAEWPLLCQATTRCHCFC